ncbi:5-formyltetrahydrofolate cyclo-ligase [Arenicella sp. 4NH20-0111]|uniref:5-formyltetrahydrofolate cyclo-ligase n=1 Tax=Arenicella sp. 4NH20-0111 TaxID=3127648 RepID=UPI00333F5252
MHSKHVIRQHMRQQRRSLGSAELHAAANDVVRSIRQCRQVWNLSNVASYAEFDGELSPKYLLESLTFTELYLPTITCSRSCSMHFYPAHRNVIINRFGIKEPRRLGQPIASNKLDLILLPLVAFDRTGNRIGMGSGYYDRALESLAHQQSTRPLLVGLAHHFQEVTKIQASEWDIKLDAILTDREYIPVSPNLSI